MTNYVNYILGNEHISSEQDTYTLKNKDGVDIFLVDKKTLEEFNRLKCKLYKSGDVYKVGYSSGGKNRLVTVHTFVASCYSLGCSAIKVGFLNGNTKDCRYSNLVINRGNGYYGVIKAGCKYKYFINISGHTEPNKKYCSRGYASAMEAAVAHDKALDSVNDTENIRNKTIIKPRTYSVLYANIDITGDLLGIGKEGVSHVNSSSKYVGVSLNKKSGKWAAYITVGKRHIDLGRYNRESEAALIYNIASKLVHGAGARLNNIDIEEPPYIRDRILEIICRRITGFKPKDI